MFAQALGPMLRDGNVCRRTRSLIVREVPDDPAGAKKPQHVDLTTTVRYSSVPGYVGLLGIAE